MATLLEAVKKFAWLATCLRAWFCKMLQTFDNVKEPRTSVSGGLNFFTASQGAWIAPGYRMLFLETRALQRWWCPSLFGSGLSGLGPLQYCSVAQRVAEQSVRT